MPVLPNPREEHFAQAYVQSGNASEAWRQVTGKAKNADVNGPKWLVKVGISQRIAELHADLAAKGTRSIEDVMKFCEEVIFTPLANLDENSPIVQEVHYEQMRGKGNEDRETVKIKLPSKMDAIDKLAKLRGWYAAEKVQVGGSVKLDGVLDWIGRRKK